MRVFPRRATRITGNARNRGAGYGRLVRVQRGGGGMMVCVPSNGSITPVVRKSSARRSELCQARPALVRANPQGKFPLQTNLFRKRTTCFHRGLDAWEENQGSPFPRSPLLSD